MIFFNDPSVGGTDGVGKIFGRFLRVFLMIDLANIALLARAVFGNFPFVPDFDASLL